MLLPSFLKAKQKCLGEALTFLETIDPPAEGPYTACCTSRRDAVLRKVCTW